MLKSSFASLESQGARVTAVLAGDTLQVSMSGSIEVRDPGEVFNPYWKSLDETLRAEGIKQVELDLSELDFMNSSGILTLVRWIILVKSHLAYTILVHHDRNLTWQKTNVPVLAKLAPAVVRLATP